jgi:hypothetical protein
MVVQHINSDTEFDVAMQKAVEKNQLVICDFFADWFAYCFTKKVVKNM